MVAEQFANTKQSPVLRSGVHPLNATVETIKENDTYDFSLTVAKESSEDVVRATGRIVFSERYDRTIIRGEIWLDGDVQFVVLGCLFIMVFLGVIAGDPEIMFGSPVFVVIMGMVLFAPIKGDYNILVPSLEAIINEAQSTYSENASSIDLNLQMPAGNKSASNDYYESAQE